VLLLADTHLGFDDPLRPRVLRRRRGPEFLANVLRALAPALEGEVDLVVHGGDLLHRARVPAASFARAMAPFLRVAERGVPVVVVPGNHERGRLPFPLLRRHEHLLLFDRPRTFRLRLRGLRVALAGFPFTRDVGGAAFSRRLAEARATDEGADVRLLCLHQTIEGATVGARRPHVFRPGRGDVVLGHVLPSDVAAVLAGHIHRAQVLSRDLAGRPLPAPVLYPGSVERTSFQERREAKGFLRLEIEPGPRGGRLHSLAFTPLPARPMVVVAVDVGGLGGEALARRLAARLAVLPPDAVVRLEPRGRIGPGAEAPLTAAGLRALAPPTMNVTLPRRSAPPARHEQEGILAAC